MTFDRPLIIMPGVTPKSLFIHQEQFDQTIVHLKSVWPEEGCGFIGGLSGVAQCVIPVTNMLHNPSRFLMDPEEQVAALHTILEAGMEVVGIFHSHPKGPGELSTTDLVEAAYPETPIVVFWPEEMKWRARAFSIQAGEPAELDLVVI